ncbi:hypothetical protein [Nocardia sp. CNY236]|uniref:hypothetical protein n=1 Tax=Nocardia sp. CNY236 TaxID=1169152 RepID=UPI00040019E3|nr:hypothetical protein [Nocardia sp. CNY236]
MSADNRAGNRNRRRVVRSSGPPTAEAKVMSVTTGAQVFASHSPSGRATTKAVSAAGVTEMVTLEKQSGPQRGSGYSRILELAAVVLVCALVSGAVLSVFVTRSVHQRDELRAAYVQTARQAVINLTNVNPDTVEQDLDRMRSMTSGKLRSDFSSVTGPMANLLREIGATTTGEVVEAALESADDRSGRVFVAAIQTLTNSEEPEPQTRKHRFVVDVSHEDGNFTVSKVEQVP